MEESTLQMLSRALTHLVFRNGIVESLHAGNAALDDTVMEMLNRDVHNRLYTLLSIWFCGTDAELERLEQILDFSARFYGRSWDPATKLEIL